MAALVTGQTREDGKCGPDWGGAKCEHIPPFPTCCQANGHCGWDCDSAPAVADAGRPAARPAPAPAPAPAQTFVSTGNYRPDGKCGPLFGGAECDPNSEYWCCSEHGFCGGTQEHCYCDTCVNYRPVNLIKGGKVRTDRRCGPEFPLEDGRVRVDRRCGPEFPLDDGLPSECDGSSFFPCCSKWGYCGPGAEHCSCGSCVDYRTGDQKQADWVEGKWRTDRRCGSDFPLPDGSGEPGQCNPNSETEFCCSKWGYCGRDEEHCGCPECINYAK